MQFVDEATEQMHSATSIVKTFVTFLYNKLASPKQNNNGISHLLMIRFSKALTVPGIKNLKKLMIFIREKDDALKETSG